MPATEELLSGHSGLALLWISSAMNESARQAIDRRPIATRNRKWAQSATAWLASRNVSPNVIWIAGMCACIAGGIALSLTSVAYYTVFWLIAALGAQLRLTANCWMAWSRWRRVALQKQASFTTKFPIACPTRRCSLAQGLPG